MRPSSWLVIALSSLLLLSVGCSDDAGNNPSGIQCSDGADNDGDGDTDFPDDLGCDGDDDETEDSLPSPQCSDGRDNDGDGKRDFPNDPGCFAPQQDSEEDDCPSGPSCPQCANGLDDDGNGQTDFPNDSGGCTSASDVDEYTANPVACGSSVMIKKLPFDGKATGMLMAGAPSRLMSTACGGTGAEEVYEIRVTVPKVIVASTENDLTTADTVLYLRTADCQNASTEVACHDNVSSTIESSTLTAALSTPGTYYLVVDSKDAVGGMYDLSVQYFVGEGTACQGMDDCGPGLVCRIPLGGNMKICSKHVCEDNQDEDGDGKNGYPQDPGCDSPTDDDEADTCPPGGNGMGCPECGDGIDNDGDTNIDFGMDTTCSAASSASESCVSSDGVTTLIAASTADTTVGAVNDVKVSCATSGTHTAPDKTYRLDLPAMATLTIATTGTWDRAVELRDSSCVGTPLACSDPGTITQTNLQAGSYFFIVDGWSTASGAYNVNVSGTIVNGASCESALAQAGAITCAAGYACQGSVGSRTCQPAVCSDGMDNDNDGRTDYPADPGCDSPGDVDEANPAMAPVCFNTIDDDMDGLTDYPMDFGCVAASGTTEVFCSAETDPVAAITTSQVTGTTTGKANNYPTTCSTSNAPEVMYALSLPVPVATLVIDTNNSGFDTILQIRDSTCATAIRCDDDSGDPTTQSKITLTGVQAGNYGIQVDGYSSNNGSYVLNVKGTVATGTFCDSPLFSGGANAVLACPSGTTCTGNPRPTCQ